MKAQTRSTTGNPARQNGSHNGSRNTVGEHAGCTWRPHKSCDHWTLSSWKSFLVAALNRDSALFLLISLFHVFWIWPMMRARPWPGKSCHSLELGCLIIRWDGRHRIISPPPSSSDISRPEEVMVQHGPQARSLASLSGVLTRAFV